MLLKFDPANPELHNLLGTVLAKQGLITNAVEHFQEALRLNPRFISAHSNLVFALNFEPEIDSSRLFTEHCFWDRLHGQGLSLKHVHTNDRHPASGLALLAIGSVSLLAYVLRWRKRIATGSTVP